MINKKYINYCKKCGTHLEYGKCPECEYEAYSCPSKLKKVIQPKGKKCYYCESTENLTSDIPPGTTKWIWLCPKCSKKVWAESLITRYPSLKTSDNPTGVLVRNVLGI